MTAAEYSPTPETPDHRFELQEGAVVTPASPGPDHQDAPAEVYVQLRGQTPPHLKVLLEVDLDLHLPLSHPGTRAPSGYPTWPSSPARRSCGYAGPAGCCAPTPASATAG